MPKDTKKNKPTKGDLLASSPGLVVTDLGGLPLRSKKYALGPRQRFLPIDLSDTDNSPVKTLWIAQEGTYTAASAIPFNTSAQLGNNTAQAVLVEKLKKRARSKFVTNTIAVPLASLVSPLENSYRTTLRCSGHLTQAAGKLTGLYCGQRWCVVCARIRTAKMMAGYLPQIEQMGEKWFLTCTIKNVKQSALVSAIDKMLKDAAKIGISLKKWYRLKYSCLRKLECTYNPVSREYHPHFHFIFSSEAAAQAFLSQWLKRNPTSDPKGQDIKKADNNSVKELFKYFTKIASGKRYNPATGQLADYGINIAALDVMFQAMRGRRVFQPSGIIKSVSEEINPDFALPAESDLDAHFSWMGNDWIDKDTGQLLSGYEPTAATKEIASHIVMPAPKMVETVDHETGEVVSVPAVRFGQLSASSEIQSHEYGPLLPIYFKTPSVLVSRPAVLQQLNLFSAQILSSLCTLSIPSHREQFQYSKVARPQQPVKSGGGFVRGSAWHMDNRLLCVSLPVNMIAPLRN